MTRNQRKGYLGYPLSLNYTAKPKYDRAQIAGVAERTISNCVAGLYPFGYSPVRKLTGKTGVLQLCPALDELPTQVRHSKKTAHPWKFPGNQPVCQAKKGTMEWKKPSLVPMRQAVRALSGCRNFTDRS